VLKSSPGKNSSATRKPAKNPKPPETNHTHAHTHFQAFNYKIYAYDRHQQAYRKNSASVFHAAAINISRFQMDALQQHSFHLHKCQKEEFNTGLKQNQSIFL